MTLPGCKEAEHVEKNAKNEVKKKIDKDGFDTRAQKMFLGAASDFLR